MNHDEATKLKIDLLYTCDYHLNFLSRYLKDNHMCDDVAWWGRELYKYHLDDQNVPVYGARMLFGSKQKLNLYKYTLWTDLVHLTDACCFIR